VFGLDRFVKLYLPQIHPEELAHTGIEGIQVSGARNDDYFA